jgi:hypothetical protein
MERRYVYGIVRPADAVTVSSPGIGGHATVGVVSHGELGAIVSSFAGEVVKANRRNLTAHSRVLEEALETATVVPMRFGVLMPSDEVVAEELLRGREAELGRLLDSVEGRVELSVKAFYRDDDLALREVLSENPTIARLNESTRGRPADAGYYDRIRLGQAIVDALRAKREQDAEPILSRLGALAVSSATDDELPERMVVKAAFLVERQRVPDFDRAVDEIARETADRLQFKYLGPLAPHTFATLALPARVASTA